MPRNKEFDFMALTSKMGSWMPNIKANLLHMFSLDVHLRILESFLPSHKFIYIFFYNPFPIITGSVMDLDVTFEKSGGKLILFHLIIIFSLFGYSST